MYSGLNTVFYVMRIIILLLFSSLLITSCQKKTSPQLPKGDFDYLIGNWERTNEQEGKKTFEQWSHDTESLYTGIGYTLQDNDTIWKEHMQLIQKDTIWTLEIYSDKEPMVPFTVINKTYNSFAVYNPTNEFPKHIIYTYFDDTLTAIISSDDTKIPFIFWRVE